MVAFEKKYFFLSKKGTNYEPLTFSCCIVGDWHVRSLYVGRIQFQLNWNVSECNVKATAISSTNTAKPQTQAYSLNFTEGNTHGV